MIFFLTKGLLRDKYRSLFPLIVVTAGVALIVLLQAWIDGATGNMIENTARFKTGHVRVTTQASAKQSRHIPIDLSLTEVEHWLSILRDRHSSLYWKARTRFGGILDFPDEKGETSAQGPVVGLAVDLLSSDGMERNNLNLKNALIDGRLPRNPGEILVSDLFFKKLNLRLGQSATLISTDMEGGMAVHNFTVVGSINFGIQALDRGAILTDLTDVQQALNMIDASSEILGYFKGGFYQKDDALHIAKTFNLQFQNFEDLFSPVMKTMREQDELGKMYDLYESMTFLVIAAFVFIMAIVLWNTGLMSGMRRYGELGVRMALGESQGRIYRSLLAESLIIGVAGSFLGTLLALIPAYYLQVYGIDVSQMIQSNQGVLLSNVMRAQVTPLSFFIGFIPGVFATFLGALISGFGIYKRQTAELFKELET
ncbi:MAG: FtsX-like permease family protein [SAR324 cluster bacterium]|nr:FtsX-like permease family protein [SAR324 cluster bacterium]